MIKFFRKIRQRLLTGNKFSKYLLYAIGEIVLVVIGILIALGINNANETSKEKKLEKQLINRLYTDYSQNKLRRQHPIIKKMTSCQLMILGIFFVNLISDLNKNTTRSLIF